MTPAAEALNTATQDLLALCQMFNTLRDNLRANPDIQVYPATLSDAIMKVELALNNLANAFVVHPLAERQLVVLAEDAGQPENTILP